MLCGPAWASCGRKVHALSVVLLIVLVAGVALGVYALVARRTSESPERSPGSQYKTPITVTTDWTTQAGEEFSGLSESDRCDLIFAVAALDDERSHRLLVHALGDPSDGVALASAHALGKSGHRDQVERFVRDNPGVRADALLRDLTLLE